MESNVSSELGLARGFYVGEVPASNRSAEDVIQHMVTLPYVAGAPVDEADHSQPVCPASRIARYQIDAFRRS